MKRREAREKAVQTLFQLDKTELTVDEAIGYITEEPIEPVLRKTGAGNCTEQRSN